MIIARYVMTEDNFMEGCRMQLNHASPKFNKWLELFWPILMFALALDLFIRWTPRSIIGAPMLMALGFVFILQNRITLWKMRKSFQNDSACGSTVEWRFGDEGFEQIGSDFTTTQKWQSVAQAIRTPNGFLIFPQEKIYYWVPFHAFKDVDEVNSVDALIVRKVKKYRRA